MGCFTVISSMIELRSKTPTVPGRRRRSKRGKTLDLKLLTGDLGRLDSDLVKDEEGDVDHCNEESTKN
jgi:hypothetical protein